MNGEARIVLVRASLSMVDSRYRRTVAMQQRENVLDPFYGTESAETYRERNQWLVDALRSDEYPQAKQTLQRNFDGENGETVSKFCCLGVACRVAMAHGVTLNVNTINLYSGQPSEDGNSKVQFVNPDDEDDAGYDVPPVIVQRWYGWVSNNPILFDPILFDPATGYGSGGVSAATLNDSGETFEHIADCFEYTYITMSQQSSGGVA